MERGKAAKQAEAKAKQANGTELTEVIKQPRSLYIYTLAPAAASLIQFRFFSVGILSALFSLDGCTSTAFGFGFIPSSVVSVLVSVSVSVSVGMC